jgi:hypothetical protein
MGIIQTTSRSTMGGNSTMLANLHVVLATTSDRVRMCGYDMSRSRVWDFLGFGITIGFTSVNPWAALNASCHPSSRWHERTLDAGFWGKAVNPPEQLEPDRVRKVIQSLAAVCDMALDAEEVPTWVRRLLDQRLH